MFSVLYGGIGDTDGLRVGGRLLVGCRRAGGEGVGAEGRCVDVVCLRARALETQRKGIRAWVHCSVSCRSSVMFFRWSRLEPPSVL